MRDEISGKVLGQIDDEEIVRLACDLIRIPSFTTEETPCAEWLARYLAGEGLEVTLQVDYHDVHVDLEDLFLCTRVLALTALEAAL